MKGHSTTRAAMTSLFCVVTLLALDPSPAAAQVASTVGPGSRARVTTPSLGLSAAIGTVREATDDSLLVQFVNPRRLVRIERDAITVLEVSIDRHGHALKGLGMGTLVGAGTGAVLGLASGDDPPGFLAFTAGEKALVLGVFFGATGAVVGLIAGALTRSDVWSPVTAGSPPPVDVSLLPFTGERGTGLRVGVSLVVH